MPYKFHQSAFAKASADKEKTGARELAPGKV
jgi:hypothetical protein